MGKICVEKVLNKAAVKEILNKAWGIYPGFHMSDLDKNMYLFSFSDETHVKDVMLKSLWYIMNYLLSLQFWLAEVSPYELDFNFISFWIQIHNLPLEFLNCKNVATLMKKWVQFWILKIQ